MCTPHCYETAGFGLNLTRTKFERQWLSRIDIAIGQANSHNINHWHPGRRDRDINVLLDRIESEKLAVRENGRASSIGTGLLLAF